MRARIKGKAHHPSPNTQHPYLPLTSVIQGTSCVNVTVTVNGKWSIIYNKGVGFGINITKGTLTIKGPGTLVVKGATESDPYKDKYDNYYRGNGFSAINGNIIIQGATVNATGGSPRGPQRLGRLTVCINNDNTRKNPSTASRQAGGFFF